MGIQVVNVVACRLDGPVNLELLVRTSAFVYEYDALDC